MSEKDRKPQVLRRVNEGSIQLPWQLREKLGLDSGNSIVVEETPSGVLLRKLDPAIPNPVNIRGAWSEDEQAVQKLYTHLVMMANACEGDAKKVGLILRRKGFLPTTVHEEGWRLLERFLTSLLAPFNHDEWDYFVELTPEAAFVYRSYMAPRKGLGSGNAKPRVGLGDCELPFLIRQYCDRV
jgi:bifunctional DNA-binding transcriptional regulator/antitoxin component of YhaV-PrlF toxin-antitoxin module